MNFPPTHKDAISTEVKQSVVKVLNLLPGKQDDYLCYAVGAMHRDGKISHVDADRFVGYMDKALAPAISYDGWLRRNKLQTKWKADRADWIAHMLKELA